MKLVVKILEALDKEWFSEYVSHLLKRGGILDGEFQFRTFSRTK